MEVHVTVCLNWECERHRLASLSLKEFPKIILYMYISVPPHCYMILYPTYLFVKIVQVHCVIVWKPPRQAGPHTWLLSHAAYRIFSTQKNDAMVHCPALLGIMLLRILPQQMCTVYSNSALVVNTRKNWLHCVLFIISQIPLMVTGYGIVTVAK